MKQVADHDFADVRMFDLGKLEYQCRGDMRLFVRGLAEIELPRLAVVVGEAFGADAAFLARFRDCGAVKALGRFPRRVVGQGVGLIGDPARRLRHLHVSVTLMVGKRALGRVDRDLVEIGRTQSRKLGVEIGEQAALQQRIVREIDARHHMRRAVSHLFGFGEEIVRPAIQHHAADHFQRHQFFGNQLGGVQMIEREAVCLFLREQLHREFPLGELARCDGVEHVAAMEILIGAGDLDGLVPDGGLQAELGTPVEFDES